MDNGYTQSFWKTCAGSSCRISFITITFSTKTIHETYILLFQYSGNIYDSWNNMSHRFGGGYVVDQEILRYLFMVKCTSLMMIDNWSIQAYGNCIFAECKLGN